MTEREPMSWRTLIPSVYLPALLFEIGVGAMLPVLATRSGELGASEPMMALIAALLPIGKIAADVPAGAIAAKLGDRTAMIVASAVAVVGMALLALAPSLAALAVAVFALGATDAVYALARQSYLTESVPVIMRARALSTLGGVHRIGLFIGPFAGAGISHLTGQTASIFWLGVFTSILAAIVVAFAPEPAGTRRVVSGPRMTMLQVLREHRRVFTTLGIAVLLVGAVRGARMTAVPLWAESLGLDATQTSLVFGIAGGIDMLLFYPAGKVMDLKGRLWVAVPSMLVMAVSMMLIPTTSSMFAVTVVAVVLGFGNGIGSGVIMTLGADTAPAAQRAQFLGIWRLFADVGNAGGPLIISLGAVLGSLAAGLVAMGAVGVAAAGALYRWVPRGPARS